MNPKPSLYMQSSMHWLVLYSVASPKISLYMQGSMALASPGVARTLYETKAFIIHAEFNGTG